jgi:hypothetical protein
MNRSVIGRIESPSSDSIVIPIQPHQFGLDAIEPNDVITTPSFPKVLEYLVSQFNIVFFFFLRVTFKVSHRASHSNDFSAVGLHLFSDRWTRLSCSRFRFRLGRQPSTNDTLRSCEVPLCESLAEDFETCLAQETSKFLGKNSVFLYSATTSDYS